MPGQRPGTGQWRRAGRLVRSRPRALIGPPFLVYLGLLVIATVLIPLLIADFGGDLEQEAGAAVYWLELALLLFVSGVYWTQAVMVTAVDAVRTGERIHLFDAVRRASVRVNGLTVALLLLAVMTALSVYTLFVRLVLVARFALVVPAIVLEDDPVLGAFRRSWRLTRRLTGQTFVFFLGSAIALAASVGVALGVAFWIVRPSSRMRGSWPTRSRPPSRSCWPACRSAACWPSSAPPGASSTTTLANGWGAEPPCSRSETSQGRSGSHGSPSG